MRSVARRMLLSKRIATPSVRAQGQGKTRLAQFLLKKPDAHVCVIRRVGGIGDVLMLTPTLRELRRRFPKSKITFAIDMHTTGNNVYYELVKNAPFVDELIDARYVQRGRYDFVFDASAVCLRYERRGLPNLNRIDLFAQAAGLSSMANKVPFYQLEPKERRPKDGKFYVLLHTASNEDKRCWPIQRYLQLIDELQDLDCVFLVADFNGKHSNWSQIPKCKNISDCSIRELAAWIDLADVFVGPDSGPMHLAGALGTRTIALFGSIPPGARINHYPSHEAVTSGAACAPCWYAKCPYDVKCMKDIEAKMVAQKIRRIHASRIVEED
jgi:ADP-heptose:LPS heptosyltransferase